MWVDTFFIFLSGFMAGFTIGMTFGPEIIERYGKRRRDER